MRNRTVALVTGDGSGPEMMKVACEIAFQAALKDNLDICFVETPMGWNAYEKFGDTLPLESFNKAVDLGTVFFGGVGDPKWDNTIGKEKPEMKPEARCLLALRKKMGLLLNFRPMIYYPQLRHLANVKPETIPDEGIQQVWIRFLLQDSYFGNEDLAPCISELSRGAIGMMPKKNVTGEETMVSDVAYFTGDMIRKYIRAAFAYAKSAGLPLISIDKANVMSRYEY